MSKKHRCVDPEVNKAIDRLFSGEASVAVLADITDYYAIQELYFMDAVTELTNTMAIYLNKKAEYQKALQCGNHDGAQAVKQALDGLHKKIHALEQNVIATTDAKECVTETIAGYGEEDADIDEINDSIYDGLQFGDEFTFGSDGPDKSTPS